MPLPFPGLVEWTPAYSVGIASIDGQHQLLVSMIRRLQEAMIESSAMQVVVPLFAAMHQYTQFHFEYEEQLLQEHGYPGLESHRQLHAELIARLADLEQKYTTGRLSAGSPLMQFLRTWLLDHIGAHDKEYAPFLKEKGVS